LAAFLPKETPLPRHPATQWARLVDQPENGPKPVKAPRPCPPVKYRPRQLSVTEIETWLADPYAIYAKRILKLPVLKPLEQSTDAADYGTVVHNGIARFLKRNGVAWPDDAAAQLRADLFTVLAEEGFRPALAAWWRPRLALIADWIAATETKRRPIADVIAEKDGRIDIQVEGGFTLTGRADRIERRADNTLSVLDYKTGAAPSKKKVQEGLSPQLTLEAAMLLQGGFGERWQGETSELAYWKFAGASEPGEVIAPFGSLADITQAAADAVNALARRVVEYDDPETPYLAQPHPDFKPRFPDYAQLARVAEWGRGEDE
jgi:ATP-dependent helicase/nuclease subunit B